MEENKQKTAEDKAKEKTIQKLLAFTSAKTFSRHALLSEKDYVKEIGYEGMSENEAVNKAIANLMSDFSVTRMKIKAHLDILIGIFEMANEENKEKGVTNNGK